MADGRSAAPRSTASPSRMCVPGVHAQAAVGRSASSTIAPRAGAPARTSARRAVLVAERSRIVIRGFTVIFAVARPTSFVGVLGGVRRAMRARLAAPTPAAGASFSPIVSPTFSPSFSPSFPTPHAAMPSIAFSPAFTTLSARRCTRPRRSLKSSTRLPNSAIRRSSASWARCTLRRTANIAATRPVTSSSTRRVETPDATNTTCSNHVRTGGNCRMITVSCAVAAWTRKRAAELARIVIGGC